MCPEDEDEDTFQKFKARERKKLLFQAHLLDCINTQLTDAIGKQRLLMVNWIMEARIFQALLGIGILK